MEEPTIKPCPFCAGRGILFVSRVWSTGRRAFYVECEDCHSWGVRITAPKGIDIEDPDIWGTDEAVRAVLLWNKRSVP